MKRWVNAYYDAEAKSLDALQAEHEANLKVAHLQEGLREIGREAVSVNPDVDHIARMVRVLLADGEETVFGEFNTKAYDSLPSIGPSHVTKGEPTP